jgi:peptide-methionine (S)-S-oxide reductase
MVLRRPSDPVARSLAMRASRGAAGRRRVPVPATLALLALAGAHTLSGATPVESPKGRSHMIEHRTETATLAGGCFWCLEAVFVRLKGVERVVSGYAGGAAPHPTYEQVCSGATGHAECVQVTFDPAVLSYRDLLRVFFAFHDPTTRDRQGPDTGTQYRSAIFWHDPGQKAAAIEVLAELTRGRVFDAPLVTEVAPLTAFYPAEEYHQGFYDRNPDQAYCRAVISPKVARLRRQFASRLRETR